jgi:addiction module HigA family antidote
MVADMEINSNVKTNVAITPRMLLKDELNARGMSQRLLATFMGRPANTVSALISGQKALTARTAVALEHALAIPAHLWLHLEANYRLALERGHSSVSTRDY